MLIPIEFYQLSATINVLTTFLLGTLVLIITPNIKTNRIFAYFCYSISFWNFFYLFWLLSENKYMAEFYLRTIMVGTFFTPSLLFHFTNRFVNSKNFKTLIILNYLISIFFMINVYSSNYAFDSEQLFVFPHWLKPGFLFHFTVAHTVTNFLLSLFLLKNEIKKTNGTRRNQVQYIYVGLYIAIFSGFLNYLTWYRLPIQPFLNVLISTYVIMTTFAIFKHQLLDIKIIIQKGLIYSLLITLVSLSYLIFIFIAEKMAQSSLGYTSIVQSIIIAFVLGVFLIPLRHFIQRIVERYIFKGTAEENAYKNEMLMMQVAQSEKFKTLSTLSSGLAHEIKNPLTAITTFCEHLPKKIHDKEFLENFSKIVGNESARINDLVDQLLEYGKPAPPAIKDTDINKIIIDTTILLSNQIVEHKIELISEIEETNNHLIKLDPNQFRQALLNLFLNAIDVMPSGGILRVMTALNSHQDRLTITISDTGPGIHKSKIKHIFDPFYTSKDTNTGLGLSITQGIIERHGGRIFVKSTVRIGTEFIIELPIRVSGA